MNFLATKAEVANRGVPPDSFLVLLVNWGRTAPESIFAVNDNPADIYAVIRPTLGPWQSIRHRRAAMLEAMRVTAGFESSWNWNEGVDTTNQTSMTHIEGQETGIFQVSHDSVNLDQTGGLKTYLRARGIISAQTFISQMKTDYILALEYFARLVRVSVAWDGPVSRHEIDAWLSRDAVAEIAGLLA